MTAALLALASALAFAGATVLQQRTAARVPRLGGAGLPLLGRLAVHPGWLAGLLAGAVGLGLHAAALRVGQLAVVQPLLVTGMLFALAVGAVLDRVAPPLAEWLLATLVVTGLAVFVIAANPAPGLAVAAPDALAVPCATAAVAAAVSVGLAHGPGRRHRAALLGAASGISYGVTAALIKQVLGMASAGTAEVLTSWPLYGLLGVGAAALVVTQTAYQAGGLSASLPLMTISDPLVATVLGAIGFGEHLASTGGARASQLVGFALMTASVVALARRTAAGPNPGHSRSAPLQSKEQAC